MAIAPWPVDVESAPIATDWELPTAKALTPNAKPCDPVVVAPKPSAIELAPLAVEP
jgi:hypothetical protein